MNHSIFFSFIYASSDFKYNNTICRQMPEHKCKDPKKPQPPDPQNPVKKKQIVKNINCLQSDGRMDYLVERLRSNNTLKSVWVGESKLHQNQEMLKSSIKKLAQSQYPQQRAKARSWYRFSNPQFETEEQIQLQLNPPSQGVQPISEEVQQDATENRRTENSRGSRKSRSRSRDRQKDSKKTPEESKRERDDRREQRKKSPDKIKQKSPARKARRSKSASKDHRSANQISEEKQQQREQAEALQKEAQNEKVEEELNMPAENSTAEAEPASQYYPSVEVKPAIFDQNVLKVEPGVFWDDPYYKLGRIVSHETIDNARHYMVQLLNPKGQICMIEQIYEQNLVAKNAEMVCGYLEEYLKNELIDYYIEPPIEFKDFKVYWGNQVE